jgi:hypothetical protein
MNIEEKMEMVMANEEVKISLIKKSGPCGSLFFCAN